MALTKEQKNKLQQLLSQLESRTGGSEVDLLVKEFVNEELSKITTKVKESVAQQTIQKIRDDVVKFKEEFNLQPLEKSIENLEKAIEDSKKSLLADFEKRIKALPITPDLTEELENLRIELEAKIQILSDNTLKEDLDAIRTQLQDIVSGNIDERAMLMADVQEELDSKVSETQKQIDKVRTDFNTRLSNIGGGSPPPQFNVNSSVASTKYADFNFLQGGNIGWSVTQDDTLKRFNIQASILVDNGGAGGSGITRSTSVLSVSSTLAAVSATDYSFFPNVGINLTLPTAVGNTNRYTIKNMVASSVLVTAAAGQDIDGATTALLSNQFESIDLQSNGSVWGII